MTYDRGCEFSHPLFYHFNEPLCHPGLFPVVAPHQAALGSLGDGQGPGQDGVALQRGPGRSRQDGHPQPFLRQDDAVQKGRKFAEDAGFQPLLEEQLPDFSGPLGRYD